MTRWKSPAVNQPVTDDAEVSAASFGPSLHLHRRVVIEHIRPDIDAGRFPIKRTVGEQVTIRADIFADGHDVLAAALRHRTLAALHQAPAGLGSRDVGFVEPDQIPNPQSQIPELSEAQSEWRETPMQLDAPGTD